MSPRFDWPASKNRKARICKFGDAWPYKRFRMLATPDMRALAYFFLYFIFLPSAFNIIFHLFASLPSHYECWRIFFLFQSTSSLHLYSTYTLCFVYIYCVHLRKSMYLFTFLPTYVFLPIYLAELFLVYQFTHRSFSATYL